MKRRSFILFAFLFLLKYFSFAQDADLKVTDSSGVLLYSITNGVVTDAATKKPVLNIQGNMIFKDTSEAIKDVELLVRSEDIFSKTMGHAYKYDMRTIVFSISRGKYFLDDADENNPTATMAYYKVDTRGNMGLYAGLNNKLIALVIGNDMSAGALTAIFYLFMNKMGLDVLTQANIKAPTPTSTNTAVVDVSETSGTIRRVWNTGTDEFIWDGFSIKRKFNSLDNEEWNFDGHTLKRAWPDPTKAAGGNDGYSWDGKELKRKFNTATDDFVWDGKVIRRVLNTGADEFSIDGNSVKRTWDPTGNDEWETTGDVPVPVIAMVVFGLLSK